MLTRHSSRELVLQALFNLDSRYDIKTIDNDSGKEVLNNVLISLHKTEIHLENDFIIKLFEGTLENLEKIDDILSKTTPDWGLEKTAIVDRNILRMAIYEMLFTDSDVPSRVVINEAIELAKTFSGKKSYKFVSGVLGSVYETAGLREIDEKERAKKTIIEKRKVGAMPYYFKNGKLQILLVHNIFKKWTLPKGSFLESSKEITNALGEILKEKINVNGVVGQMIGENKYRAGENKTEITKKDIFYYLFEVTNPEEIKLNKEKKGLNNLRWFALKEFQEADKYEDMELIFKKGLELLSNVSK